MEYLQVALIFIAVVLLLQGLFLAGRAWWNPERRRVREQLRRLSGETDRERDTNIMRRRIMSDIPWFNRLLLNLRMPLIDRLELMGAQANLRYPPGFYLLTAFFLCLVVFLLASLAVSALWLRIVLALAAGYLPFLYIRKKKAGRLQKLEEQLPEALDMLARSLRAGHAFTGGIQMIGQEFGDPVGTEFRKTLDEINFGIAYEDALKNMVARMDSDDLKLFVISVIIQRESGGNLAEILENIARLIRARFVLKGQIKTLSAEARLSAVVLTGLPFLVGTFVFLFNREYIQLLFDDPVGHVMLGVSGIMLVMGIIILRRMARLRV